jgi:hypothetical protein
MMMVAAAIDPAMESVTSATEIKVLVLVFCIGLCIIF